MAQEKPVFIGDNYVALVSMSKVELRNSVGEEIFNPAGQLDVMATNY